MRVSLAPTICQSSSPTVPTRDTLTSTSIHHALIGHHHSHYHWWLIISHTPLHHTGVPSILLVNIIRSTLPTLRQLRLRTIVTHLSPRPPTPSHLHLSPYRAMSWNSSIGDKGEFKRKESSFRHTISADPTADFPAQPNRYHLYVCLACPWAHRTLIVKRMKGLDGVISHTCVDWFLDSSTGWRFTTPDKVAECEADPIHGYKLLRELYRQVAPEYGGNITVPVLYDKVKDTIVNNESSEIIRMLNSAFNAYSATPQQAAIDLYPTELRPTIDSINDWVYPNINNGVYRSGFAQSQQAYDTAVHALFQHLDKADAILSTSRYLCGNQLTEADIRLFTTLFRFDSVYHGHFKCNMKQLKDYANLYGFLLELYQRDDIRATCNEYHCKHHYYMSHAHINPTRIVPDGPVQNWEAAHGRDVKFPVHTKS